MEHGTGEWKMAADRLPLGSEASCWTESKHRGVSRTSFYEILVAASLECLSRIVEVVSCYEISRARNFFATFCKPRPQNGDVDAVNE